MKKQTIWILTILMAVTFASLLYMQIMYMRNIVTLRYEQFTEGVKRSLYGVVFALEQDEARYFLEEGVTDVASSSIYTQYLGDSQPQLQGVKYSFRTSSGLMADLTLRGDVTEISRLSSGNSAFSHSYRSMRRAMQSQYLYQKGILDEVIINIISKSSTRPIRERADSAVVANYLRQHLDTMGLSNVPFEFAVVNRADMTIYKTPGFDPTKGKVDEDALFVQTLFPHDGLGQQTFLKVYFPTKKDYIYQSISFFYPSFIFTLIILIIFLYTIIVAFRQKKLTEMKNDFINNMTHELKTPISSISLAGQMLNDQAIRKSPSMLNHISSVINDETKRLRFLVEKVLQMSLLDNQAANLRITDVDANVLIDSVTNTFKLKVEKYGGKLTTDLEAENAIVSVDEMHFTNVIFNLLDNAVKYRREDEPLNLTVTTRDISGERLEITVSDNGIGIKAEDLKKIFEKFYRVSTGNRHDIKGFGLGLAYVHKMITSFNGEISVKSDFGHGTTFSIILPLAP